MAQPDGTSFEVTVDPSLFELMQKDPQQVFEKELGELNFDEVALLVGGIVVATVQADNGKGKGKITSKEGLTIIDLKEDGKVAFEDYTRQTVKEMAAQVGDGREIILNVMRNQTLWEVIRNHQPKVARTYHFRNEPSQYP